MEGKDYLLALSQCEHIGPSRLHRLGAYFDSWQAAWEADAAALARAGLELAVARRLVAFRSEFSFAAFGRYLEKHGISVIAENEAGYPKLLKQIYQPPPLIYCRGSLDIFNRPTLAVVGTRKATSYGRQAVERMVGELADAGIVIVSGLALGIDALAHEACLNKGGITAAVLASGPEAIYPATNRRLGERIAERGCLISEFRPGVPPLKSNFPRRNRLIAGLCLGTLVIEASEKSGSLITARYALQENREVMAVPGPIYSPASGGTNGLLRLGARIITETKDVIAALKLEHAAASQPSLPLADALPEEAAVLDYLDYEPKHINELCRLTELDMSAINSRLTVMEIKGLVKNIGNMSYIRIF